MIKTLAGVLALTACLVSLFVSGYVFGRASTAGRTLNVALDAGETREVLQRTDDPSRAFVAAAALARPAVVHILTTRVVAVEDPYADWFEQMFQRRARRPRYTKQQAIGSGAIVDSRGVVLTNAHVVREAVAIDVHLADGRRLPAKLLGIEEATDLAVLKIEGKDLPALALGDSDQVEVGQWLLAIGNPFGLEQTVTSGILSAKGRSGVGVAEVEDFLQTDAPINPGNSGGPLVDLKGRIVGVNTAIFSRSGGYQGIGFAIPINFAKQRMEAMLRR